MVIVYFADNFEWEYYLYRNENELTDRINLGIEQLKEKAEQLIPDPNDLLLTGILLYGDDLIEVEHKLTEICANTNLKVIIKETLSILDKTFRITALVSD